MVGRDKNVEKAKDQNRQTNRRRNAVENKQDNDDKTVKDVLKKSENK